MNTINPFSAKTIQIDKKINHSLHHHRSVLSKPFSPLCFRTPLKASSSLSFQNAETPKSINPQNPFSVMLSVLKPTIIATITATSLFLTRFHYNPKPAFAVSLSSPHTTEANVKDSASDEENEKALESFLLSNPNDVDALRNLMEIQIKNRKLVDAISTIDKLIELEPNETEWHLLKSHLYVYNGELELAKTGFSEILKKDPFRVEAYHGLVMVASQEDSVEELKEVKKKVEEGIKMCDKESKKSEMRDFMLLLAQIWVIESKYEDALKVYQELVKEEPKDFRPYLCQGIIYTLLSKKDEAEKSFEEYRRLVPQGHPYARYFDDNLIATKLFSQKVETERSNGD
ncbi:protein SLOW GREEN 1, chloroplastic-like [Solanum pennellii]|uniref:Protein SLOW GREEN 1, chloroplastic-like n=1 Tax=Solanum pennellii TaxID=28526 RepID=A0ABM1UXJ8_SOLPN|nr:protein SLOW GREEN 1, chloroplastic-like [Solanum pennellii]